MLKLMILVIWSGSIMPGLASRRELLLTNECTCPGIVVTFRCTVVGNVGATVWRGSAIECPETNHELTFLHLIRFTDIRGCSGGAIIGHGIDVEGNCYTSQLNVTVDTSMDGKSVECFYNNGTFANLIGNSSVAITSDPFPPPYDVTVMVTDVSPPELTFEWSPVSLNCPDLHYIITFNCGICPFITTNTTTICSGIQIGTNNCTFTIQTNVCDSLTGDVTQVPLILKVPNVPVINVIPRYSHSTQKLFSLQIEIHEADEFHITNGLDGSPVYHTVTYTNSVSGIVCDSINIQVSSCTNGVCRHSFNMSNCSSLLMSDNEFVIVNVLSANVLGSGPSNNATIGFMNTKVQVTFSPDMITSTTCKFLNSQWQKFDNNRYYCSITYEPLNNNHNNQHKVIGTSQNNTVVLNFTPGSLLPGSYHFTVNATDGLDTTLIEGTFDITEGNTVSGLIFGVSFGVMGLLILIITVTAVLLTLLIQSRKQASKLTTTDHHTPEQISEPTSVPEQLSTTIDTERNVAYISLADARQSVQVLRA